MSGMMDSGHLGLCSVWYGLQLLALAPVVRNKHELCVCVYSSWVQ
jgi:hypothetical protein